MVVNTEGFFGKLGIEFQTPQIGIRCANIDQFKTKVTLEHTGFCSGIAPDDVFIFRATQQMSIVIGRQGVSLWHTRDGAPLAIGTHENIICVIQDCDKAFELVG